MDVEPTLSREPSALLAHGPFLTSIARALVGDEHVAEDAVQDAWVRALERGPEGVEHPRGWLRAVTANFARRIQRGESRRRAREERVARPERLDSAAHVAHRESVRRAVLGAVLELREPYRETVLLRFYDDLPPREVARRLGVPVATVRTRTRRGLEQLRGRLDRRYGGRDAWAGLLIPLAGPAGPVGVGVALAAAGKLAAFAAAAMAAGLAAVWMTGEPAAGGGPVEPVASSPSGGGNAVPARSERAEARAPVDLGADGGPVSGCVVSRAGEPVARALVRVLEPAEGVAPALTFTGDDGRFRFECAPGVASVRLALTQVTPRWVLASELRRDAQPGADDVEFVVDAAPTATVELRAVQVPSGRPVLDFEAWLWRVDTRNYFTASGSDGAAVFEVPLHPERARTGFRARLADGEGQGESLELRAGERRLLVLEVPREELLVEVVDTAGAPVEDALVFLGNPVDLRGDEPFKPSVPSRIESGARTDAQGMCTLRGGGRSVSVFHPEYSTVTVPLRESARIELSPRAAIAGRVVDGEGDPRTGVLVTLDRARTATTDASGRFRFEAVEEGIRGLQVPGTSVWAYYVRAVAGETVEVELGTPRQPVRVAADDPARGESVLLSLGDFGVATRIELGDEPVDVPGLPPGEYLLASEGLVSRATLADGALTFEAGTGTLTVRTEPGRRVYVAPAGIHEQADLICQRVARANVPTTGEVRFERLLAGTWAIGYERVGAVTTIEIAEGRAAEIEID